MFPAGFLPRQALFVEYEGDEWLHERVVLSQPSRDTICVVTPHWDRYIERLRDYGAIH